MRTPWLRLLLGAIFLCTILAIPAVTQQVVSTDPPRGIACAYNTSPPAITSGFAAWVQCDSSGRLATSASAGGTFTPVAGSQYNLAVTTSTALTVPSGATYATVQAIGATVYYTTVSTETPTSTNGNSLFAGASVGEYGSNVLAGLHFISATGTINVSYYK